ncbi:MAG: DUF2156 domain-containing protein [Armatimonadota bacterium]
MIPTFPDFKPIELADKDALETYVAAHPPLASEYNFTNLFGWREVDNYHLAAYQDGFLIRKFYQETMSFLQPLVPEHGVDAVRDCLAYLQDKSTNPVIERVGEDFVTAFPQLAEEFAVREDRDNFDYLYSVQDLIDLKGAQYHDKKNLLNQFINKHNYRYLPLTAECAQECLQFAHSWCEERRCERIEGLAQENCATVQILQHFAELGASGGILEVEDKLVAFTIGEPLNPDTFVIHIEKGAGEYTGVYQAINWEYLRHAATGYTYVNREQDLGVPGLRKAKESYNPVRMGKKFRVSLP